MKITPMTASAKKQDSKVAGPIQPMDRWLKQQLVDLYGDVLDEPLPPELQELARQLEDKLKNNGSDS